MAKTRFEVEPGKEALRKRGRMTATTPPAGGNTDGTRFCRPGTGGFAAAPQAPAKAGRQRRRK